jgi:Cu2+-exporting ATPase
LSVPLMDTSSERRCFHCDGPVGPGTPTTVLVDGTPRVVCCAGCGSAAQLILSQGLGRYYQFRSPAEPVRGRLHPSWEVFDREAAVRRYTHLRADGERELGLHIEGMHCAACAWLIENSLRQLDGVTDIQVNPSSARALLRYDPRRVTLSRVLERIHALGYIPKPLAFTAGDGDDSAERRQALRRLGVAGFGMMQVMTFAVSLYAGAMQGMAPDLAQLLRFVSLLVATPVVLYAAQPFFATAWRSLRAGAPAMDVPVALSIGAAYLWSVGATLLGRGALYFDSAVMFTFFLLLGRFAEMSLRHRSGQYQDALARLLPDSAARVAAAEVMRVTPEELEAGDRVRVMPGERIPADGEILNGSSDVDEALLTGESVPQLRVCGDQLIAGTLNLTGVLEMRVTRVGQDSTLACVSRLLERAGASKPRIADLADRVAGWFVVAVLLLAAFVGLYWLQVDPSRAFPTVLAVLVVTCPCALSLATPAALAAATMRLARCGLLVTRARALERLASADRIVFDKTGTLTRGQPRIERVQILSNRLSRERVLAIAAALERHSAHPIAHAFAAVVGACALGPVRSDSGRGLEAAADGVLYRIGRPDYVLELVASGQPYPMTAGDEAHTTIMLGDPLGPLAAFELIDALRDDALQTLSRLRELGLEPLIASGDRQAVVAAVGRRLDGVGAQGGMCAADKLALVQALQAAGHPVAMVGDGVNDAPVLAAADVSVAIGGGTDLAKVSADLVLLGEGLAPLVHGVETARLTRAVIRENLTWAVLYNATAVPLAALGWLQPWMAAIGMSASSLLVVLNAMRLLKAGRRGASPAPATPAMPAPVAA